MDLEITTSSNINMKTNNSYTIHKTKYDEIKSKYFKIKENYTYTKKMENMILTSQREESQNSLHSNKIQLQIEDKCVITGIKTVEKLETAKRSAIYLENISKNVMVDLENQTEKLSSINTKINLLNASIGTSTSLISKIMNREYRHKLFIGIFSATLVTLFIMILYSRS